MLHTFQRAFVYVVSLHFLLSLRGRQGSSKLLLGGNTRLHLQNSCQSWDTSKLKDDHRVRLDHISHCR